jgi:hypothetical protein
VSGGGRVSLTGGGGRVGGRGEGRGRRKIRLKEANAKGRHLKNLPVMGLCGLALICLRPRTQYPSLHSDTLFTNIQYTYSHREGGGGWRGEPVRRLEGQKFTTLGRKYQHDWLFFQSMDSDKHLPQSSFTGQEG